MILKVALYHILVIWGLAQVTAHLNRANIPAGVRSSMMANGWRPLTTYEGKNNGQHSASVNGGGSSNERHSGPHPVHGKLQEHMSNSEKLTAKQNKQNHEYNPPSILGSFSVFGHSMAKVRGHSESSKSHANQVASETREFSFLVPPPRDPVRYEIEPYRKVVIRDNDVYLRQPTQYIISNPVGSTDHRNPPYFTKGGAAAVAAASTHTITTSLNRPVISEYNGVNGQQQLPRHQQQQHIPFESLKLSNTKLYLQPPSANGPSNFAPEQQQPTNNIYDRYIPSSLPHAQQLSQESAAGNFYSHINHPSPSYKGQSLDRDPSFLVHESHEISYPTLAPSAQPGFAAFGNYRPASPYESLHPPERYSTPRPNVSPTEKFVPSKTDDIRQNQENYGRFGHNNGNANLENNIASSPEPTYSNGLVNTYYITGQQTLTPPAPTWSTPAKAKATPDINEVLPKANRPAKFNAESVNIGGVRQNQQTSNTNVLFPRPEIPQQHVQQQYYPHNPLPLINQQPEPIYETPESVSLKHFNEQQYRLQQQLLQRDRERLREQELQRQQQQIELERLKATREREKVSTTTASRPLPETPKPTVQYIDTTVTYTDLGSQGQIQEFQPLPGEQFIQQEYHENLYKPQRPDVQVPVIYEAENVSTIPDIYSTTQPERTVTNEFSETPSTAGQRTRTRKPTAGNVHETHRRRKPTTPLYEENSHRQEEQYHLSTSAPKGNSHRQEEQYHSSTLAPKPIVQSPGSPHLKSSSTEAPTTAFRGTSFASFSTVTSGSTTTRTTTIATTTTPTTTQRPRTRRPTNGNVSSGRRRRPTSTTTQEPETAPPVTYQQEDYTKYERFETDLARRRKLKPSSAAPQAHHEIEPTTSTEKKRFEIQNYGHKLGANEQDYITESPETYNPDVEQVSLQQSYAYGNEQDSQFYTPTYDNQVTTGQEFTDYETSGYPTISTVSLNQAGIQNQHVNIDNAEVTKSVYTNLPLEEYTVNTARVSSTTPTPTTTTATTTTTARATTAAPTRSSHIRTTTTPATTFETAHTTRPSSHRMRPMRFGNTTRPRFSIKDYKSRLDYRNRISTSTETPSSTVRHKAGSLRIQHETENESVESTTARYRHMTRASYRMSSTTPSYHSRRGDSGDSTTERTNKFAPKRRLNHNHLYRSKISTSTATPQSAVDDADVNTSPATKQTSVRTENVFSSAIRRRPQMKHSTFTQSSDTRTTRKDSTEMIPEETSFYSPAFSQLLVTDPSSFKDNDQADQYVVSTNEERGNGEVSSTSSQTEVALTASVLSNETFENPQPIEVEDSNLSRYPGTTTKSTTTTTNSPLFEMGQTEALVKESYVTVNSQLEEDLFAKASQSVADLTSSASALYDKPGMFKAVSVAPSAPEAAAVTNSRFRITQDKPTLPIEAFFQEFSKKIASR